MDTFNSSVDLIKNDDEVKASNTSLKRRHCSPDKDSKSGSYTKKFVTFCDMNQAFKSCDKNSFTSQNSDFFPDVISEKMLSNDLNSSFDEENKENIELSALLNINGSIVDHNLRRSKLMGTNVVLDSEVLTPVFKVPEKRMKTASKSDMPKTFKSFEDSKCNNIEIVDYQESPTTKYSPLPIDYSCKFQDLSKLMNPDIPEDHDMKNVLETHDNITQYQRDNTGQCKRDNASQSQRDNASHSQRDNASQSQRDNTTQCERDNTTQCERDNTTQCERDNTRQSERDNTSQPQRDNTSQSQSNYTSQSQKDNTSQLKKDNTSQSQRDNASQSQNDNTDHSQRNYASRYQRGSTDHSQRNYTSQSQRDNTSQFQKDNTMESPIDYTTKSQRDNSNISRKRCDTGEKNKFQYDADETSRTQNDLRKISKPDPIFFVDPRLVDNLNFSSSDAKKIETFLLNRLETLERHIYYCNCEVNAIPSWSPRLATVLHNLARRRNADTLSYLAMRYNTVRRIPLFEIRQQFVEILSVVRNSMTEILNDVRNVLEYGDLKINAFIIDSATNFWTNVARNYEDFHLEFCRIKDDYPNFDDVCASMEEHFSNVREIFFAFHEAVIDLFESF